MKTKILLLTFLLMGFCFNLHAQDQYYLSVYTSDYTDLSGTTSLSNGEIWDDPNYDIPIGFEFDLFGQTLTTLEIAGLGGTVGVTSGVFDFIGPMALDLIDRADNGNQSTSQSPISYKLDGNPGSHILKIEWKNTGFYSDFGGEDYINFQLWIYEGSNDITMRYGPSSINNDQSYEGSGPLVGIGDNYNMVNDVVSEGYFLTGPSTSPELEIFNNASIGNSSLRMQGDIPNGTVYRISTTEPTAIEDWTTLLFTVFPNPAQDVINIEGEFEKVNILNLTGQLVKIAYTNSIDIADLNTGVYFVEVVSKNGEKATKKLIKR